MEDLYFQTRSPSTGKNSTELMDSKEDEALYLAMEMVEDMPVEVPPLLRKRKLNGRPKYKIKGCCLPPSTDLTSNLGVRKYRVGLRRLIKMQPNSTEGNGLVNVEKKAPLALPTGQTKGTILPYLSNKCAIGMKLMKVPEKDAKYADGNERQRAGVAKIPDDGKNPNTKSMKSSTKRGGGKIKIESVW